MEAEQGLVDELQQLAPMIGTWDETVENKDAAFTPGGQVLTSVTTTRAELGGRYIFERGRWNPPGTDFLNLITYDSTAKEYLSWYFDASGVSTISPRRGRYDPKTRTLTWTSTDAAGNRSDGTNTLIDDDHNEWTMVTRNPAGEVVFDAHGRLVRRFYS